MRLHEFEPIVKEICGEDGGIAMYEIEEICDNARELLQKLINKGRMIHHSDGWYTAGLSAHKARTVIVPMDAESVGNLGPQENTGNYRFLQRLAGLMRER